MKLDLALALLAGAVVGVVIALASHRDGPHACTP